MMWPMAGSLLGFLAVATAELWWPVAVASDLTRRRWMGNFGAYAIGTALMWLPPVAMATGAIAAATENAGLLRTLALSDWLAVALGLLLLDATYYAVHRLFH